MISLTLLYSPEATFALMDLSNSGMSEMFNHRPYKEGRISDASRQYNGPV